MREKGRDDDGWERERERESSHLSLCDSMCVSLLPRLGKRRRKRGESKQLRRCCVSSLFPYPSIRNLPLSLLSILFLGKKGREKRTWERKRVQTCTHHFNLSSVVVVVVILLSVRLRFCELFRFFFTHLSLTQQVAILSPLISLLCCVQVLPFIPLLSPYSYLFCLDAFFSPLMCSLPVSERVSDTTQLLLSVVPSFTDGRDDLSLFLWVEFSSFSCICVHHIPHPVYHR